MRYVLAVDEVVVTDELADPGPRHPAQVQQRDSPVAQVVPLGVRIVTQPVPHSCPTSQNGPGNDAGVHY